MIRSQPARTPRALALAASLCVLALACVPRPGGQCDQDLDCEGALTCQDGLCRPPPPRQCAPACETGFHCDDGFCGLDAAPVIAWIAPETDALRASGALALALSVQTLAKDVSVKVIARPAAAAAQVAPKSVALVQDGDGVFRALLDVGALEERDWTLTPVVTAARRDFSASARGLRIDRTGPTVEVFLPAPKAANFLRTDVIEVRARLRDPGAGVEPRSVRLVAEGMDDLEGQRVSQTDWTFTVPLSLPTFRAAEGPLSLAVRAEDHLGNAGRTMGAVPVTRVLWRKDVGKGAPIRSSVALDGQHLFVGTDAGYLVGLERAHGSTLWSASLPGPLSASPVRGERAVYAVSEGGRAMAFEPGGGALLWSCVSLPYGVQFFSSPALGAVSGDGADGSALETLFVSGTGGLDGSGAPMRGGLYAIQGTRGFLRADGGRTCWLNAAIGGGRSSPALDTTGAIYVGGDSARAHKLRLAPDTAGVHTFREEWSLPATDDVVASPAVGAAGIFFGDVDGKLQWVTPTGAALLPQPLSLGEKLFSSPVIAFGTALVQGRDGSLVPFTSPAPAADFAPTYTEQRIAGVSNVESTPAVGADGTLYVSAGRSLRALSPGGALLWEAPLAGASTASSPNLGCDGVLFLGDASGTVTALATDSRGLAPGWPRFRHDARGTGNAATVGCE